MDIWKVLKHFTCLNVKKYFQKNTKDQYTNSFNKYTNNVKVKFY